MQDGCPIGLTGRKVITMKKVYKLNLNKFAVFVLLVGTIVMWGYLTIEILLGLAGM